MKLPFDKMQMRFLRALAEALFDEHEQMAIPIDQVLDNLQTLIGDIGGTKARELHDSVQLARIGMAPLFNQLPVDMRKGRIRKRMQNTRFDMFQDMARLRSIVYLSYYGHWIPGDQAANRDNPVHKQIGFTLPKYRKRAPDERQIELATGRELHNDHFVHIDTVPTDIDVIVVGSGSGGAVSAFNLAQYHKVLVIEAGPFHPSERITHEEGHMTARLFKHGALQTTKDMDFVVFQGRNVGGSPTVNNGICLRMFGDPLGHPDAANPLDKWRSIGAPIDQARFAECYDAVQSALGIGEIEHRSARNNGPHLIGGWDAFAAGASEPWIKHAKAGWFAKNYGPPNTDQACVYCGYCNTGCPYGRKSGMAQTYLPWACQQRGARILADTKVDRILWQAGPDGKKHAIGVEVIDNDGVKHLIRAKVGVVVAGGTIASSLLLERSGIDGTGGEISMNVASPIVALMPEGAGARNAWDEDQMATVVDCGQFLLESHFQPPLAMASLMPGWFCDIDKRMRNYNRLCSAGVLFPADRRGRLSGGKLDFKLTHDDIRLLRKAAATLTKVHFAAGAEEVYPALERGQTLKRGMSPEEIDAFFASAIEEADDVTLSSSHPHGGNPMNDDPSLGVVNSQCRLHAAENVLVTDASVFPSCIRVNAQFTVMAMAQYATGYGDPFA
jgi:choline dehydrogenase-like flavoprotein